MTTIHNEQQLIDSRDVIERIEELKRDLEEIKDSEDCAATREELIKDLASLEDLEEQASYAADWEHGETLIRRDYFVSYITEMIDECYPKPRDIKDLAFQNWPYCYLTMDYEAAARAAEVDYKTVFFNGQEYLIRI